MLYLFQIFTLNFYFWFVLWYSYCLIGIFEWVVIMLFSFKTFCECLVNNFSMYNLSEAVIPKPGCKLLLGVNKRSWNVRCITSTHKQGEFSLRPAWVDVLKASDLSVYHGHSWGWQEAVFLRVWFLGLCWALCWHWGKCRVNKAWGSFPGLLLQRHRTLHVPDIKGHWNPFATRCVLIKPFLTHFRKWQLF